MHTNFLNDLLKSKNDADSFPVVNALEELFPGLKRVQKTSRKEDLAGADRKAVLADHQHANIDLKVRSRDPKSWGEDDLVVELYSVYEKRIRGYRNKNTDFLLWIYTDTGRAVLIPFQPFLDIYEKHWDEWEHWLAEPMQWTRLRNCRYRSQFALVPYRYFEHIARVVTLN